MKTLDRKALIQWALALVVSLSVLLLPETEVFTGQLKVYLTITLLAIFMFAFELMDSFIVAVGLPVAYIAFKLTDAATAFGSSWANTAVWMMLGSMLLGNCLEETGFLKRFCYWLLLKSKGHFTRLIWAYFIAGIVANYAISSGGIVLFCLLSYSMIRGFGFEKHSNEAAILMCMAYFVGNSLPVCLSYGLQIDMYMNIGKNFIPDLSLGWLEYAFYNLAFLPYMILVVWVMYRFIFKPKQKHFDVDVIKAEYDALGKVTTNEKKAIVITLCALFALIFNAQIGLAVAWIFIIAGVVCFLPGINIGNQKAIKQVNYSFLFFMAGCLSIGTVGMNLGVAEVLKPYLATIMDGGVYKAGIFLWLLAFVLNKIMTPLAAGAAFAPIVAQICASTGINPVPFFLIMCNCFDNVLFPYESAPALQTYAFGMISMRQFIKMMGVKTIINFIWIIVIMVPYWTILGLF